MSFLVDEFSGRWVCGAMSLPADELSIHSFSDIWQLHPGVNVMLFKIVSPQKHGENFFRFWLLLFTQKHLFHENCNRKINPWWRGQVVSSPPAGRSFEQAVMSNPSRDRCYEF
jgi:hypothetical protein